MCLELFTTLVGLDEKASFAIALLAIAVCVGSEYLLHGDIYSFLVVTGAVSIAFLPHELMHRYMARKLGCYSRFVLYPLGLLLTLATALLPIKFIMPGFVLIASHYYDPVVRKRVEGLSAVVGPLTNIVIAVVSLAILLSLADSLPLLVAIFLYYLVLVNAIISFLNLLPIPPLDGSKIIAWKPLTWVTLFITSIILMVIV